MPPVLVAQLLTTSTLTVQLFYQDERLRGGAVLSGLPALAAAILGFLPIYQIPQVIRTTDAAFQNNYGVEAVNVCAEGIRP